MLLMYPFTQIEPYMQPHRLQLAFLLVTENCSMRCTVSTIKNWFSHTRCNVVKMYRLRKGRYNVSWCIKTNILYCSLFSLLRRSDQPSKNISFSQDLILTLCIVLYAYNGRRVKTKLSIL